jgi:hypothetical protein
MEFCTCNFRWNSYGWAKAVILWNFVLSAALGVQRLTLQVGLLGLLPGAGARPPAAAAAAAPTTTPRPPTAPAPAPAGEEVVTRESFISICWRLVPYWLNNWEHQWGAECSSMMFELPHFAAELLVVLPCVQVSPRPPPPPPPPPPLRPAWLAPPPPPSPCLCA